MSLVLMRRVDEAILVRTPGGEELRLVITEIQTTNPTNGERLLSPRVRLAIDAPKSWGITRPDAKTQAANRVPLATPTELVDGD